MNNPIIVTDKTLTYYDYKLKGYIGSLFGCDMTVEWEPMENGKNYFKLKIALKNKQGDELFSKIVDFPLEQTIVSGEYNNKDKSLILYFQDGSYTSIPIEDLIEGLASKLDLEKKANLGETCIVSGDDYSVDIPTSSAPYTQINKIGGMSYKDGNTLRDAKVTEVKSVGRNLFGGDVFADKLVSFGGTKNASNGTVFIEGWRFGSNPVLFSNFKPNTQYTFIFKGSIPSGGGMCIAVKYTDNSTKEFWVSEYNKPITLTFTTPSDKSVFALIGVWSGDTTFYYNECGIFEGILTVNDFAPYTEHTLAIPNSVQSLEGYGLGADNTRYNYIDFEGKKYIRKVKKITVNAENITYTTTAGGTNAFMACINITPSDLLPSNEQGKLYGITSLNGYTVQYVSNYWQGNKQIGLFNDSYMFIANNDFSTLEEFKALCPFDIVYYSIEKAEDIEITDNLISVEGNGTLTFENQYGYNVPYEIEYTLNSNDVIGAKEFVGNLKGTAEIAKYYEVDGSASAQTIGEALTQLLGAGNPIKITTESIGQLSTTQVLTGISANIITNPPVAINDIILDRYLDGDAAYLCFWLVTNVSGGSTDSTMTLQGAGNIYVGGGSASVADKAIADGDGRNIVNTYETKANATSNKTELQTNIDTVDAARQLNTTDITNIKNGTTPVGKANYANNPSGNLDATITNILTDLAKAVTRDKLNTDYFNVVNDLIKVIKADSAVYASGNESAGTIDDRIRNAESLASTAKSEATIAATSASQLATQLIARAECTYAPDYSQGGAMALKLTLYTKTNQAIEVSGFQSAIDNYFADILN